MRICELLQFASMPKPENSSGRRNGWDHFRKRWTKPGTANNATIGPKQQSGHSPPEAGLRPPSPQTDPSMAHGFVPCTAVVVPESQVSTLGFMTTHCRQPVYNYYFKYVAWQCTTRLRACDVIETNEDLDRFLSAHAAGKYVLGPLGLTPAKKGCQQIKLKVAQHLQPLLLPMVSALLTHAGEMAIAVSSVAVDFLPNYTVVSLRVPEAVGVEAIVAFVYDLCQWFEPRCTPIVNTAVIVNRNQALSIFQSH